MKVNYFNMAIVDTCQHIAVEAEGHAVIDVLIPHYMAINPSLNVEEVIALKLKDAYGLEGPFEFSNLNPELNLVMYGEDDDHYGAFGMSEDD
jgi:hypothetical protein